MLFNGLTFFYEKKLLYFFNNKNTGILARVLFIVTPLKPIGEHFCKKKCLHCINILYSLL